MTVAADRCPYVDSDLGEVRAASAGSDRLGSDWKEMGGRRWCEEGLRPCRS